MMMSTVLSSTGQMNLSKHLFLLSHLYGWWILSSTWLSAKKLSMGYQLDSEGELCEVVFPCSFHPYGEAHVRDCSTLLE